MAAAMVLLFALLRLIIFQAAAYVGSLYGMHRYLEPLTIGEFDFDHFAQAPFLKLIAKILAAVAIPCIVFHGFFYILHNYFFILRFDRFYLNPMILFLLEFGAFFALSRFLLELDPKKSAMLAAANSIFYLILYALFGLSGALT